MAEKEKYSSLNFFFFFIESYWIFHSHLFQNIASNFAKEYLRKRNNDIIRCVSNGATWTVKFQFWKSETRTRAKFGVGWKAFVQDNNLKVGDVCVLELINNIEVAFKVAIFRDAKDTNCPPWNGKE